MNKDKMDFPMESLTSALWGNNAPKALTDNETIEIAARKIRLLKSMLISSGVCKDTVKALMENI
jgi:hypothetical protein